MCFTEMTVSTAHFREKRFLGKDCTREYRKRLCDGYGFGYTQGIKEAFEQQREHDETGWGVGNDSSKRGQ